MPNSDHHVFIDPEEFRAEGLPDPHGVAPGEQIRGYESNMTHTVTLELTRSQVEFLCRVFVGKDNPNPPELWQCARSIFNRAINQAMLDALQAQEETPWSALRAAEGGAQGHQALSPATPLPGETIPPIAPIGCG